MKNKLLLIDGAQTVGKTFLLQNTLRDIKLNKKIINYKFNFAGATNDFYHNKKSKDFRYGLSLGNDLLLLDLLHKGNIDVIMDRSFLSSIVWGEMDKRTTKKYIEKYVDYLNNFMYLIDITLIYIYKDPKNIIIRDRFDGFDDAFSMKLQDKTYRKYIDKLNFKQVHLFENKFDKLSVEDFSNIIKGWVKE